MRLDLIARLADGIGVRSDKAYACIDRFICGALHKERLRVALYQQTAALFRKISVYIFARDNSRRNLDNRTLTDIFAQVSFFDRLAAVKKMAGGVGMGCRVNTGIDSRKVTLVTP